MLSPCRAEVKGNGPPDTSFLCSAYGTNTKHSSAQSHRGSVITPLCSPSNKTAANAQKEQLGRRQIKPDDLTHSGNVSCLKSANLVSGGAKGIAVGPLCNLGRLCPSLRAEYEHRIKYLEKNLISRWIPLVSVLV